MKVENIKSLQRRLESLKKKAGESNRHVVVGFTQSYAIHVHENLSAKHAVGKEAKYLEGPARRLASQLRSIIDTVTKKTGSLPKALLVAGFRLLREAQAIVPIDTGALRASGFVAMDRDAPQVAAAAYDRSETMRREKLARKALRKPATKKEKSRRRLR